MDRLIGFHHVADEVEAKVQEGPSGDVEGYIKVLDRLKVALDFFHANNPSSVELSHVQELFEVHCYGTRPVLLACTCTCICLHVCYNNICTVICKCTCACVHLHVCYNICTVMYYNCTCTST